MKELIYIFLSILCTEALHIFQRSISTVFYNKNSRKSYLLLQQCNQLFEKPISSKIKILCLHGYLSSGKEFQLKIRKLLAKSDKYAEFTFLNAPNIDRESGFNSTGRAWWIASKPNPLDSKYAIEYTGIDSSLQLISNAEIDKGPFDILIGHSQGGSFCHALNLINSNKLYFQQYFKNIDLETLPSPTMNVNLNGFLPRNDIFSDYILKNDIKLDCMCIHVISNIDDVVPSSVSREAISLYSDSKIIEYEGSHFPPYDEAIENKIVDYIYFLFKNICSVNN